MVRDKTRKTVPNPTTLGNIQQNNLLYYIHDNQYKWWHMERIFVTVDSEAPAAQFKQEKKDN